MNQNQLMRRYYVEFTISMTAYAVVLIASVTLLDRLSTDSNFRTAIALAPVVPVVFVLIAIMRLLVNSDELQQRIQLFAISFAAVTTALLTFSYGFLEGIGFPRFSPIWVFPLMTALWGLGLSYFSRRYR
jgi:hypothetical protein